MLDPLDEDKRRLLTQVRKEVTAGLGDEQLGDDIVAAFYRDVDSDDMSSRSVADLAGPIGTVRGLAQERERGQTHVAVLSPEAETDGWDAHGSSVLAIVTDDMPFLVDTVTMTVAGLGSDVDLLVHPQLWVRRDADGHLQSIVQADPTKQVDRAEGVLCESWMYVEFTREDDPAELAHVRTVVERALGDVRASVQDWQQMNAAARTIVDELERQAPASISDEEARQARDFLSWLADDHFAFLGYREYTLVERDGQDALQAVPGSGLGILRGGDDESTSFNALPASARAKAREQKLLIITKANSHATVHRPAYLDYVGVKTFDEQGNVTGERRFLGLFSSAAYTESVTRVPMLREKVWALLDGVGFHRESYSGKHLLDILENYPRDELFQAPLDQLVPLASQVVRLRERRAVKLFLRPDDYGRYMSCMVYLPRDRYTTAVRERIMGLLQRELGGDSTEYTARVSESVLARLHVVVRVGRGHELRDVDASALEAEIAEVTRSWNDDFIAAMHDRIPGAVGHRLARTYSEAFPEAYKEDCHAAEGAGDAERLDAVAPGDVAVHFYEPREAQDVDACLKVYRRGDALSLSDVLPVLTSLGVEVVDERPYEIQAPDETSYIYDFGLRYDRELEDTAGDLVEEAFIEAWQGHAEYDGFTALVLACDLTSRQVSVLRAYAKYFRQGQTPFSQAYIEQSLLANTDIARLLVDLFRVRFDPAFEGGDDARQERYDALRDDIVTRLDDVESLDQDRILRTYLTVIGATLRTNAFQSDAHGRPKPYVSFKLQPREIPDLPDPRPEFEIFVYSPRVEGVHLRFGAVARGGLRWSDRREDFRTEVLGLVKAQMVKNTVIVPVGSKGGFYCKQLPDPSVDREAWLEEGKACYRTFISGLLDITDNLVGGNPVAPPAVVRHDGDDPYLVVAADKGTASFSDIANGVAADYGFWLGDAFASGGSVGYDHKGMGITARGAWESVKRHFREMGVDSQREEFTAVGIGDMSGDVFGNGMLLSEHIRLVAAFDHRDIFLDPDPVAATSYAERQRMFDLPRSSWQDYDRSLISEGGGVYSRTLKSVPISAQVRQALDLPDGTTSMAPQELMRAIVTAPVDLLWNGGIGTYVKAASETDAQVGDKSNDAIRVNGSDLRCKAVGEGGNLGLTQRGRIEYARAGGRINTDFIDNSAGVDTSDHEVNIKILLNRVQDEHDLSGDERAALLASMTDEVAELVLRDNYDQNLALASAEYTAGALAYVHEDWMRRLERQGLLDRELEALPSSKQLSDLRAHGQGLSGPELSVLLAYTKIVLEAALTETELPDEPFVADELFAYFPSRLREEYRDEMVDHQLRREIIVTRLVNDMVNFAGITFFHRLSQETNADAVELTRAHFAARRVLGVDGMTARLAELDNQVSADVQTQIRLECRAVVERATRWVVNHHRPPLDPRVVVDRFAGAMHRLRSELPDLLVGRHAEGFAERRDAYVEAGVPEDLAVAAAVLPRAYAMLEVIDTALDHDVDVVEAAKVYYVVGDLVGLTPLMERVTALPRDDRWQTMARATMRDDLLAVHVSLTSEVLTSTNADDPRERVQTWIDANADAIERAHGTLDDIIADDSADLARLSVALRVVRALQTVG